jgi:tetratricopeptide (TPR) repeat protein
MSGGRVDDLRVLEQLQRARNLYSAGELTRAQHACNEILLQEPTHYKALHLLGLIARRTGEAGRAVEMFNQAVVTCPGSGSAQTALGNSLVDLREYALALHCFDNAIAVDPNYAEAYFGRANALLDLGKCEAAVQDFDRAILRKGDHAMAFNNRGIALASRIGTSNRASAAASDREPFVYLALQSFERAIAINPACAEAYYNRGGLLQQIGRLDAALASYDKAIELNANYAEAHSNRGTVLLELGKPEDALQSFERASAIRPSFAEDHSNRGLALLKLARFEDALQSLNRSIALNPDSWGATHNRAMTRLLMGDFANGWVDYESRSKDRTGAPARDFREPQWTGAESLIGKTILLHAEQGLGDTIQFCRYARMAAARGARVLLEVPSPLHALLQSLEGVAQLIPSTDSSPGFDFHCPLLSLPMAFNTTLGNIPAQNRYLHGDRERIESWRTRLGERTRPQVGLAWSGNSDHGDDRNRSIALSNLIPHLPPGIRYVSLQKEPRPADASTLRASAEILDFAAQLSDFADTAALCECLDLVISVDTSVAHLSAALGLETWILLPFCPDWRWLVNRNDSPWYPTATLYRQARVADWESVLMRLGFDLAAKSNWRI